MRFSFDPLPKGFILAKPVSQENYTEEEIFRLEKDSRLVITRKRNGWKLFAVKAMGGWKLYTDGIRNVTFLGHIARDLASRNVPDDTVLAGEAVVPDALSGDKLERIQSIFCSKDDQALEKQKRIGMVHYRLFDIVFWGGKQVIGEWRYASRHATLRTAFGCGLEVYCRDYVEPVEVVHNNFTLAKRLVKQKGWEGLVLYDAEFLSAFRLDGKSPQRIRGCYKWKPVHEDDFIVRHPIMDPSNKDRVKEVTLSQFNGTLDRNEFDCGKFGAFDNKTREWLRKARYPLVIQLEYDYRFDSGKLQGARFVRFRHDKNIRDCRAPRKYPID